MFSPSIKYSHCFLAAHSFFASFLGKIGSFSSSSLDGKTN